MKKFCKNEKNFQKGYLQIAFYVVNYGKKLYGVIFARGFKTARKHPKKQNYSVQREKGKVQRKWKKLALSI